MKIARNERSAENKRRSRTVAVVGLGYVGLPEAILSAQKKYLTIGIDLDKNKIESIRRKESPFADEKISRVLPEVRLPVSTNPIFLREAGIIIICVPTPVDADYKPDLKPLEGASRSVAKYLSPGTLVIVESTVNPAVCETIVLPLLEEGSGLEAGKDFYLSHCPERINPGDPKWTVESINRVVGSLNTTGLRKTLAFYRSIISKGTITPMASLMEAEAVKVVENSFRDINIAFVNELAMSFAILGIDVVNVINGASTKPFGFMAHYPGCGVGGHCIPVDPYYLIEYGKEHGFSHDFLMLARRINNQMPVYTVSVMERMLKEKKLPVGKGKIAVLGAAYKADVDDIRESPAFEIVHELKNKGYEVAMFDPYVKKEGLVSSLDEALKDSVAAIVATAHAPFKVLTPKDFSDRGVRIVVDGRNCLNKSQFKESEVDYLGIGR